MSKEKMIKVKDRKRWLIHLLSSLGIWFIFMLILITFTDNINDHVGVIMLIYVISFVVMIAYWIYTCRIFNKYVSIKEFREINKNIDDIVLKKQLLKQGFDEDEITKILKDRPVSDYIARQKSKSSPNDTNRENVHCPDNSTFTAKDKAIIIGIILSIGVGIWLGNLGRSFGGGVFITIIALIVNLPIFSMIGNSIDLNKKIKTNLPKQYEHLQQLGINTTENYISSNGNGVIIDRNKTIIAVITVQTEKPFVVQFSNVGGCELLESIEERISNAHLAYTGMLTNNDGFKETGKYEGRNIEQIYQQLGVTLIIKEHGKSVRLDIPFINHSVYTYVASKEKALALNVIDNINNAIASYTEEDYKKENKNIEDFINQVDNELQYKEILNKMKNFQKLTKEDINLYSSKDGTIPFTDTEKSNLINDNNQALRRLKKLIPNDSDDYDELIKLVDRLNKIMQLDIITKRDWANYHNYMIDLQDLDNKYGK